MIPCDICHKEGHAWYACPKRSTMPIGWKPDRLKPAVSAAASTPSPVARDSTLGAVASTNPRDDAPMASEADGDVSRLSAGRTAQGAPVKAVSAALKRGRGRPLGAVPFDKKAHDRKKAAEKRAADKAARDRVKP